MDRPREVTVEAHGDLKLAPTPQNSKNGHHKKRPWAKKQHSVKGSSKDPKAKDKEPIVKPVPYFSLFSANAGGLADGAENALEVHSRDICTPFADKWDLMLMLVGFIGGAGNGASLPIFSIVFGNLMNSFGFNMADPSELQDAVNSNVLKFLYIGIGAFVAAYLQMFCWTATSVRQVNRIRHRYLGSVLRQDVGYFDTQATSGRLLQGLNEDCITVQQGIGEKVGLTIFNLTTAVSGIVIAFTRGWDMTLVMLSVLPLLAGLGYFMSVFMGRFTSKINSSYADANSIAQQALANIRTVYSFSGEERTSQAYADSLQDPLRVGIRQGFLGGLTLGMTNCIAFCAYALAMWYGGKRIADGAYTGGDVLNVLFAAIIGGFALGQAAPNFQYFATARAAGARVFDLMQRVPAIDPDAPGDTLEKVHGSLEFREVVFAYPSRPDVRIFRSFDLQVPAGKTVALVGESGSGKSTVIGLIERFYDPQGGQVLLDGVDIRRLQLRFLRSQLGLVSQEPTLFGTTIAINISFGKPGYTKEEIIEAAKAANAHNFISSLPKGYDTHVGEKGVQMSGGQKQRIAIARAILKNPKVLLLDEATSALDAESERVVQDALDKLMVGRTTVVVAHRLSTIIHSDLIAVVKKGAVVEQGNHEQLLAANGVYATLVALQQAERAVEEEEGEEENGVKEMGAEKMGRVGSAGSAENGAAFERSELAQASFVSGTLGLAEKAVELAVVVEGAAAEAGGAAKPLAPTVQAQQAVSGYRRFFSFRRKPKGIKDETAAADKKKAKEEKPKPVSIGRLAKLNKPELPAAITGLLGSTGLGAMMPAFAIAFSSLISTFYSTDIEELKAGTRKWSLVFMGIGLGALVMAMMQSYSFNYMGQKLALRVRLLMFAALLRQEVGWYDEEKNSSGVLSSKLSADALAVKGQFGDSMGMVTQNLVTLIGGLVLAFVFGWKMTLVVIGALPLIGIAATIQTKSFISASGKEDESYAQANQTAAEALSNIRTIAAFGMEHQVFNLYGEKLLGPTKEARKRASNSGIGFGFSQFAMFGVYALAFWFGAIQVKNGENTFEQILKVFFSIFLSAMGAAQAQAFFPDVAKGKAACMNVFTIIDRKPLIDASSPDGKKPLECHGSIELREVTFAYPLRPEVQVFRKFTLTIPAGQMVALVGESGSGKSTIIGLIERFYDPQGGQVLLDGRDLRDLNLHWLRSYMALVSQEPVLFNMSVIENIRYGRPDATLEQAMEAARAANAHTFIEALPEGYDTRVGESGIQLSGGQKQRVAIARAIIKDPRVLLLDEATSALDAESERVVQDALDKLMVGRTTVVVAHRLSTVRDADAIAVVVKGKVVEQGTHDELMTKAQGAYAKLVRNQMTRGKTTTKSKAKLGHSAVPVARVEEAESSEGE
ncbi:hypothetical protein N2152v2_007986 [Parachlorella kessleri]